MAFSREIARGVGAPGKKFGVINRSPKRLQSPVENAVRCDKCEDIYQFRKSLGFSRKVLGELIGVSWFAIYYWEHGKGKPHLVSWRAFLRVRANYKRKMKKIGKDLDGGPVMGGKL
jgi:DNA-binding transcriptional regulator YiaG